jgi:hypothetical protein
VIRRDHQSVGKLNAAVNFDQFSGGVEKPDFFGGGFRDVTAAVREQNEVISLDTGSKDFEGAIAVVTHDLIVRGAAGVEFFVRSEGQAVGTSRLFRKDADSSLSIDAMNAVVGNIGEEKVRPPNSRPVLQ